MKTKLSISILLGLLTAAFVFNNTSKEALPPQPNNNDDFLLGAMNNYVDAEYQYTADPDVFGMNLWHRYVETIDNNGRFEPKGWSANDLLEVALNQYQSDVDTQLSSNNNHGMRTLMHRPKIEWLAYGQSSTYQCETVDPDDNLWFYSFNDHNTGIPDTDSGQGVVHCRAGGSGPNHDDSGFVVKRLKANTEQCQRNTDADGHNAWQSDNYHDWLIKPRIRIDSNVAHSTQNPLVCRIDIYNQNGYDPNNPSLNRIKSADIHARDFLVDGGLYYNGRYIEEYNLSPGVLAINGDWSTGTNPWCWLWDARGTRDIQHENEDFNHADIQVWWYGYCDMWIDYVKVENEVANELFRGDYDNTWLQWEASFANNSPSPVKYYIELFEFNNIPCIAYVNSKLKQYTQNGPNGVCDMMTDFNWGYYTAHLPHSLAYQCKWSENTLADAQNVADNYITPAGITEFFIETYPMIGYEDPSKSKRPSSLPDNSPHVMTTAVSPADYDQWLQYHFDEENYPGIGSGDKYQEPAFFRYNMELADGISRIKNIPFINMPQSHYWYKPGDGEKRREPTNEELDMTANLAISYGARGLHYFEWGGFEDGANNRYGKGFCENYSNTPRETNYYGEPKWNKLVSIFQRVKNKWGPTLMSFNNQDRHSYIYRLERTDLIGETYFKDIVTYRPGTVQPSCADNPPPESVPGMVYECYDERYVQAAVFKQSGSNTPYFMIVNRRCSPVKTGYDDGKRYIRIAFDQNSPSFPVYRTWKILDIANDRWAVQFDKTTGSLIDLGEFNPGEGRLYKVVPVLQSGGTLLNDEVVTSGEEFTCEDTVWTNGHNLTIEDGVTIHFSDSAKFIVHGGTFQMGIAQHSGPNTINIDAQQGNSWKGFEFDTCNVKIYGVNFSGLANDSIAMLTMIDCPVIDLRSNSFSLGSNNNVWAVDINYSGSYGSSLNDNIYIANNTFNNSSSVLPYVKVMAYSGITTPVIVEGNNFAGTSTALFLNNIQGGAIKSNTFIGFGTAITALSSSLDVFENTVSSSGSYGLQALEGTELKMSYAGGLLVGGRNNITNSGSGSDNIYLENSYFLMDEGENIFDIGTSGYHLYGWFPDSYNGEYRERENCFKVQGSVVDPPEHYVTLGEQGNQITDFEFTPYLTGCTQGGEGDMMVINLGNGIYDTIGIMGQGQGGAYGVSQPRWDDASTRLMQSKDIYDSISISMRYRNYVNVKTLCLQLLNSYPDSVQSLGAISKLYLAVSKTDTTTQGITDLKTLYENLILNHSTNISLVKRCNYYVQKCKVLLHQYSSALSGFQQIINQNPASYEGLIARWDYMATSLLMQGQGGALSGVEGRGGDYGVFQPGWNSVNAVDAIQNESDKYDDDKFS